MPGSSGAGWDGGVPSVSPPWLWGLDVTPAPLPSPVLRAGPDTDVQQPGGGVRCHCLLVGRVDQVDSVHQDLWRRCQIPGKALPEAEVQHPRAGQGVCSCLTQKVTTQREALMERGLANPAWAGGALGIPARSTS